MVITFFLIKLSYHVENFLQYFLFKGRVDKLEILKVTMTQSRKFNFQETLKSLRDTKNSFLKSNFWSEFFSFHLEQHIKRPLRKKNIDLFWTTAVGHSGC